MFSPRNPGAWTRSWPTEPPHVFDAFDRARRRAMRPSRSSNGDARAFALTRAKAHTPVLTRSMRVHPRSRPHLFPVARRPRRRAARTRISRVRCFVCGDEETTETTPDEIRVVSGCVFPSQVKHVRQTRRAGEETQLSRGVGEQVPQNAESFRGQRRGERRVRSGEVRRAPRRV